MKTFPEFKPISEKGMLPVPPDPGQLPGAVPDGNARPGWVYARSEPGTTLLVLGHAADADEGERLTRGLFEAGGYRYQLHAYQGQQRGLIGLLDAPQAVADLVRASGWSLHDDAQRETLHHVLRNCGSTKNTLAAITTAIYHAAENSLNVAWATERSGGVAAYARAWMEAGFDILASAQWLDAQCFDVEAAARLCAAGVTAAEAGGYYQGKESSRRLGLLVSSGEMTVSRAVGLVEDRRRNGQEARLAARVQERLPQTVLRLAQTRPDPEGHPPKSEIVAANLAVLERLRPIHGNKVPLPQERQSHAVQWEQYDFGPQEVERWVGKAGCYDARQAAALRLHGITPEMASVQVDFRGITGVGAIKTVAAHLCDRVVSLSLATREIFLAVRADQVALIDEAITELLKKNDGPDTADLLVGDKPRSSVAREWVAQGFTAEDFGAWAKQAHCYDVRTAAWMRADGITPQEAALTTQEGEETLFYENIPRTLGFKVSAKMIPSARAREIVREDRHRQQLAAAWDNYQTPPSQVESAYVPAAEVTTERLSVLTP